MAGASGSGTRRLVSLFEADTRCIQQTGRAAANAMRVLAALRQRPALTAGIVRELTGQRRNRVFVYDAYLAVLNEG